MQGRHAVDSLWHIDQEPGLHKRFCLFLCRALYQPQKNTSALLSAFFSRPRRNSQLFAGHRPWPLLWPSFLACADLPTPPQKRRKGMIRLCAKTSSKYFLAFVRSMFLSAKADSRVFLKCTRRSEPQACTKTLTLSCQLQIF